MEQLTISRQTLLEILKSQPESILIDLFETVMVKADTSPLTKEETKEISEAKAEYYEGKTISWKK